MYESQRHFHRASLPHAVTATALVAALAASGFAAVPSAYAETSAEKQAEADAISTNIDSLQTQLNQATDEYNDAQARYEDASAKAQEARSRADAASERISSLQDRLSTRAVDMYKAGGAVSYLEVILGATNWDDFVTSWDAAVTVASHDADLVQETRATRAEAQDAQAEYEAQTAEAASERDRASQAQSDVAAAKSAMEDELSRVNEEIAVLQAQEEQARIEQEEAEARQRAAEEAAAAANIPTASNSSSAGSSSSGASFGSGSGSSSSSGGSSSISGWVNPCPSYYGVTNEFAWAGAWDGNYHNGIDLGAAYGADIYAAGPGTVTYTGDYGTGGQAVIITHGNGVRTIYMHMSGFAVSRGQQVSAGDLIGYVGMTGYTTGPHLHFQIEINGTPVNPRNYYSF